MNGIAGSFGIAVTPVVSAWLGAMLGWKSPYIVFGILGIAVASFSLTIRFQPSQSKRTDGEKEKDGKKKTKGFRIELLPGLKEPVQVWL